MTTTGNFNKKAFFSFLTLFIWLILVVTGIILYFSPPGRIAHWIEWHFLGLTKEGWQAVHTIFSFSFIIVGAFHLYFNWIIFWSYLRSLVQKGIKMRRELIFSSVIIVTLFALVAAELPPFQSVMDLGERLSNSWGNEKTEPPVPHAELLTLQEYADKTERDLADLLKVLRHSDIQGIDSEKTIKELANINRLSPLELVEKMDSETKRPSVHLAGYGRMTIYEICSALSIEEGKAIEQLNKNKINFDRNEILKSIADRYNIKPIDIVNIIKGTENSLPEGAL
jgi:hypothetical protein